MNRAPLNPPEVEPELGPPIECDVTEEAMKLLVAEQARTGKSVAWIIHECTKRLMDLSMSRVCALLDEYGAELEETESLDEIDSEPRSDKLLSLFMNACLIYGLSRGIQ